MTPSQNKLNHEAMIEELTSGLKVRLFEINAWGGAGGGGRGGGAGGGGSLGIR